VSKVVDGSLPQSLRLQSNPKRELISELGENWDKVWTNTISIRDFNVNVRLVQGGAKNLGR
jgi:hypothetical protein